MAKPFKNLKQKISPKALARAEQRAQKTLAEMPLHELRAARLLTQESIANSLGINQAAVSKMERRADMYQHPARLYCGDGWRTRNQRALSRWFSEDPAI